MLVEVFLKLLICIVDIELFKVVNLRMGIQRVSSSGPSRVHRKATGAREKKGLQRKTPMAALRNVLKSSSQEVAILVSAGVPRSFQIQRCQGCRWIWSLLCPWSGYWSSWLSTQSSVHKVPWPGSLCYLLPGGEKTVAEGIASLSHPTGGYCALGEYFIFWLWARRLNGSLWPHNAKWDIDQKPQRSHLRQVSAALRAGAIPAEHWEA